MKKNLLSISAFALVLAIGLISFRPSAPQPEPAEYASFLFLSDIHLNTQSETTAYGGDTGMELWAAFLKKVDQVLAGPYAPRFIVYTGDLPAHYSCPNNNCYLPPSGRASHDSNLVVILKGLRMLAEKYHKPLFYLPGNNDALAGDYYSFADEQQRTPLSLIKQSADVFPNTTFGKVPGMVSDPHAALGFYSARPVKGLRLIALNTVIYNAWFQAVDGSTQASDGNVQMSWLAAQLADAEAQHEKVYIAMHVPPGTDAYSHKSMWVHLAGNQDWQNAFLALSTRYRGSIAGILYGHTHMDEVRRLYDSTGTSITCVAISCPGVTPQHNNNPGFKVVQYDDASMQPVDFTTYYTTPTVQAWGNASYTFSKAYASKPGTTIYDRLRTLSLDTLSSYMSNTYTVNNGKPTFNIAGGVEVKPE